LIDSVTSYPDHAKILDDRVKERSLRGPPQLGQVMGWQGFGSALGKSMSDPLIFSIMHLM
jgi:hypothetical protein